MELKILTYNMYKGRKIFSNKYIFNQIASALHEVNPDIMMIQEFPGQDPAKSKENLEPIERLKSDIFPHATYGLNSSYPKGNHGNLILSKFPILESQNIDISEVRFANRGLLYAKLEILKDKKPLNLLCSHLDLFSKARKRQADRIFSEIDKLTEENEALILGGDFNDWNKELDKIFKNRLHVESSTLREDRLHRTYPSAFPLLPLDRFYYRGIEHPKIDVLKGKPWNRLADHLPLQLTFRI